MTKATQKYILNSKRRKYKEESQQAHVGFMRHSHISIRHLLNKITVAGLLALVIVSCGGNGGGAFGPPSSIWIDSISITASPDANDFSAIPVDIVVIYQKELLEKLSKTPAKDYFKMSKQLLKDYPGMIEIFSWEVVPGQSLFDQPVPMKGAAPEGGFVFVNYIPPGEHRVRLGRTRNIHVQLKNTEFFISPRVW